MRMLVILMMNGDATAAGYDDADGDCDTDVCDVGSYATGDGDNGEHDGDDGDADWRRWRGW